MACRAGLAARRVLFTCSVRGAPGLRARLGAAALLRQPVPNS